MLFAHEEICAVSLYLPGQHKAVYPDAASQLRGCGVYVNAQAALWPGTTSKPYQHECMNAVRMLKMTGSVQLHGCKTFLLWLCIAIPDQSSG